MKDKKLEFYVLNYDTNAKKVVYYNIFNNIIVSENIEKEVKEYLKDPDNYSYTLGKIHEEKIVKGYEALKTHIDNIIKWQEWSRREYEISVGDAFEKDINMLEKWDCYYQARPNMDIIVNLCIDFYKKEN